MLMDDEIWKVVKRQLDKHGATYAGTDYTMIMVDHDGYRIPMVFLNYSEKLITSEIAMYKKMALEDSLNELDDYLQRIGWLTDRLSYFQALNSITRGIYHG
jgi:hypothetical protein